MGTSSTEVVFLDLGFALGFALGFLVNLVFITPFDGLAFDISADFGSGAADFGSGSNASAIFGFVFFPRDFGLGGPKVSGAPLAFGMEDGGSASAITSFCFDFPQPLPLPFGGGTDAGTGGVTGPAIPSGCFCAGDLVFGPTGFALCRSWAIVLTFVGGDGS
jgi:hypothetical protein